MVTIATGTFPDKPSSYSVSPTVRESSLLYHPTTSIAPGIIAPFANQGCIGAACRLCMRSDEVPHWGAPVECRIACTEFWCPCYGQKEGYYLLLSHTIRFLLMKIPVLFPLEKFGLR